MSFKHKQITQTARFEKKKKQIHISTEQRNSQTPCEALRLERPLQSPRCVKSHHLRLVSQAREVDSLQPRPLGVC